ncbi:CdaR family transcriptional regulator [Streptomyces sp. NPDC059578]|uniref:CdaR family transcriptional regulator n=1 Tax=unclassified Streptomyces TaxID=2593676 RepID=UPI00365DE9C3
MIAESNAQAIVDDVVARLGVRVNVMNEHGVIIASSDRSRVGTVHGGALRVLRTGAPLSVSAGEAEEWGGTRAGVNLPLTVDGRTVGVVGVQGEPAVVGEIARAVVRLAELMVMQEAFLGEAGWRHQVRRQLLEDLIAGRLTEQSWQQRQQLGGCRLRAPYALLVVRGGPFRPSTEPRDPYRQLEVDEQLALIAPDADARTWVVAGSGASAAVRHRLTGPGAVHPTAAVLDAGSAQGFTELTDLVARAGLALRSGFTGPTTLRDLEVPVLLARLDRADRTAAVDRVLGALSAELRHTLHVYFAQDCGVLEAAERLRVHRNTLTYRLRRISELTGRDPRVFRDAFVLRTALHADEIDREAPDAPPRGDGGRPRG